MLGIIDIKIPCCETKSIIFFLHAFLCKQRCRRHHEWCSSLWLKFVKKGPILPTFFQTKRRWERDCNIPSWVQRCLKKSFLALKNHTFQVKSKTTKIFIKAGHYNSFFLFSFQHFKIQWIGVNETTINQKYRNVKLITIHLIADVMFSFDCFLSNLSEEKKFETWNWFAKFYCCWCNFQTVLIVIYTNERTRSNFSILIQLKGK